MSRLAAWALFAVTTVLVPVAGVLAIVGERRTMQPSHVSLWIWGQATR